MTIKDDERHLWARLKKRGESPSDDGNLMTARAIVNDLGIPAKRAEYIFEKWTARGLYDYGVSPDLGWLTDEGEAMGESLVTVSTS